MLFERMYVLIVGRDNCAYLSFTSIDLENADRKYDVLVTNVEWCKVRSLATNLGCTYEETHGYKIIECTTSPSALLISIALILNAYEDVERLLREVDVEELAELVTPLIDTILFAYDEHEIDRTIENYDKVMDLVKRGLTPKIASLFIEDTWREPLELYEYGLREVALDLARTLVKESNAALEALCSSNSGYRDLCEELREILARYRSIYNTSLLRKT